MVEIFIDPRHQYDAEVVEFLIQLRTWAVRRRTTNFLRGPMYAFQGQGSVHNTMECKMNLGGLPKKHACNDKQGTPLTPV